MQYKRILSTCLVSIILICNTITVQANESVTKDEIVITEDDVENALTSIPDINIQLEELYNKIAKEVGIDKKYVKELHILSGGKAIYADKKPDIYNEVTIDNMKAPLDLYNANTTYKKAEFIECQDTSIERPSKYYMPDAVYSVAYDIAVLMSQRYFLNRDGLQIYFDTLKEEVKQDIIFYESILLYTGESVETVNNFYRAYEKILYDKQLNENIIEETPDAKLKIKDKFIDILYDIGIIDSTRIEYLAIIFSFDGQLAINNSIENIKDEYIVPYRLNYSSRENMMIAALGLTGKVRYVWGGGHSGASHIDGINPVWTMWQSLYPKEPTNTDIDIDETEANVEENVEANVEANNEGFNQCIKPSGSWCPLHGYSIGECTESELIYSLDDYINLRANNLNTEELLSDKYKQLLSKVDYTDGISAHTIDGLDCSGFTSWLYNQITNKFEINSTAINFTKQDGIKEIAFGEKMLPGDVFAWPTHIVVIIGQLKENSKAYVTIEQTTNVLKLGVVYYTGVKSSDINEAMEVARQANKLIGGLNEYEEPHVYCMNRVGYYTEQVPSGETQEELSTEEQIGEQAEEQAETEVTETTVETEVTETEVTETTVETEVTETEVTETITKQYIAIGRFTDTFIDEDTLVGNINKSIKNMYAKEIIQYTLTKLPISYVKGYNEYKGNLYDKAVVASNMGVTIQNIE